MIVSRRSAPLTVAQRTSIRPVGLGGWRSGLHDIGSGEALGEAAHERPHGRLGNPMHEKTIELLPEPTQRRLTGGPPSERNYCKFATLDRLIGMQGRSLAQHRQCSDRSDAHSERLALVCRAGGETRKPGAVICPDARAHAPRGQ